MNLSGHQAAGNTIFSIKLYLDSATTYVTSAELRIYSDQGITSVHTQAFTPMDGWNEVMLSTPLIIPATNLFIGCHLVATGGHPAGTDEANPAIENANWIFNNGVWQHLTDMDSDLTGSWNIRVMVSGTPLTTPVASCTSLFWNAGELVNGGSVDSPTITLQNFGGGTLTVSEIIGLYPPFTTTLVPSSVNLAAHESTTFKFAFAPTAAGIANLTVAIVTNGGNIMFELTGNGLVCSAITTFPWSEGFEHGGEIPLCWKSADADGDGNNWSFFKTPYYPPQSGTYCAVSSSWDGVPLTPDNYLITPKIAINSADLKLHFWTATQDLEYFEEHYSVMVSTSGIALTDFTEIFNETLPEDTNFHQVTLSLSAYNGQEIYIAFRHWNSTDMLSMKLDDVAIDNLDGINEIAETNIVSIFPNPANNRLCIAGSQIQSVDIYNLTGAKVASFGNQDSINISNLTQGTYLVRVIANSKVTTRKINIVR